MNCLEYKKLPWYKAMFTSREHKAKVLVTTEWFRDYAHNYHLYTETDFQCLDCHTLQTREIPQREKSLKEMDFIIINW